VEAFLEEALMEDTAVHVAEVVVAGVAAGLLLSQLLLA